MVDAEVVLRRARSLVDISQRLGSDALALQTAALKLQARAASVRRRKLTPWIGGAGGPEPIGPLEEAVAVCPICQRPIVRRQLAAKVRSRALDHAMAMPHFDCVCPPPMRLPRSREPE